jgi:hypothetical protein
VVDNTLTGGHSGAYDDPDGTTNGVKAAKLTNSSITGNTISNCGAGVSLVARENSINNVIINNNNISNIRSSGVVINNAADAITGLTFAVDNVTVQSNTISSCAANGIYVEGLAPAGTMTFVKLLSNTINSPANIGIFTRNGNSTIIQDNKIIDHNSVAMYLIDSINPDVVSNNMHLSNSSTTMVGVKLTRGYGASVLNNEFCGYAVANYLYNDGSNLVTFSNNVELCLM